MEALFKNEEIDSLLVVLKLLEIRTKNTVKWFN